MKKIDRLEMRVVDEHATDIHVDRLVPVGEVRILAGPRAVEPEVHPTFAPPELDGIEAQAAVAGVRQIDPGVYVTFRARG